MITFIIFYCCFSYLFLFGVNYIEQLPKSNIILAPITFPIILGIFCKKVLEFLGSIVNLLDK
jgi:hypothetical protein